MDGRGWVRIPPSILSSCVTLIWICRYLYITGRSKEIINKGGEVISPFEIEEAIMVASQGRVKVSLLQPTIKSK
jgi:acyl-CoA synthetase (AMP-forming)/AMP-acid ligase II